MCAFGVVKKIDAPLTQANAVLHVARSDGPPLTFRLSGLEMTVGRTDPPASSVAIDLSPADTGQPASVSRLHALFAWVDQALTLRDYGSRNGTWLNDSRIASLRAEPNSAGVIVTAGAKVRFGRVVGTVVRDGEAPP